LVLVPGCSQGTTSPTTTVLIVNGYTIEAGANLAGATMPDGTIHLGPDANHGLIQYGLGITTSLQ